MGKGLGAIIAEASQNYYDNSQNHGGSGSPSNIASACEVCIDVIDPNPYQPRMNFDEEALAELTDSIKTLGIIQPLTLRQTGPGSYQIISGERRYRAAKAAGLSSVPAYIRKADDAAMLEMAIVENIQRENLDAIETALSFQRLIDECNLTQEGMAQRVGKKRATVTNFLRLLKLPDTIQAAVKVGKVSVGHAKVLLGVDDVELQEDLCRQLIENDWSVRQLENKVRYLDEVRKKSAPQEAEPAELPEFYYNVIEQLGRHFADKVSVKRNAQGGGSITIRFDNDSQVEGFLKEIEK